jgi:taste receptor type 2
MSSTMENLFIMVYVIEFILGVFGNGFILLINSIDWIRNGMISLTDFILTCLAISRTCFLWMTVLVISFNTVSRDLVTSLAFFFSIV